LEVLKNSDYYSHLYDIVLKENNIQKRNKSENDIFGKINYFLFNFPLIGNISFIIKIIDFFSF